MEKFIPFEKLSKKRQKQINSQKRTTWNGFNPITRKGKNEKIYNRKKSHRNGFYDSDEIFYLSKRCNLFLFKIRKAVA